jgi:hypothetical protein
MISVVEDQFREGKRLQRESESLWSLHIRSFWKNKFINPPEVQGQGVCVLSYGRTIMPPKYLNPRLGSIGK